MTDRRYGIEDAAASILDVIIEHNGHYSEGDPGEVLRNLALRANVPYKVASVAVLYLERIELVSVVRNTHPEAKQANRIIAIEAY